MIVLDGLKVVPGSLDLALSWLRSTGQVYAPSSSSFAYEGSEPLRQWRRWTDAEDALSARYLTEGLSDRQIGLRLGRSSEAVKARRHVVKDQ